MTKIFYSKDHDLYGHYNYDTREVSLHLNNDEVLYKAALYCRTVSELRELVRDVKTKEWGIHMGRVRFGELFREFRDIRAQEAKQ